MKLKITIATATALLIGSVAMSQDVGPSSTSSSTATATAISKSEANSEIEIKTGETNVTVIHERPIVECSGCDDVQAAQLMTNLAPALLGASGCSGGVKFIRVRRATETKMDWICK